MKTKTTFFLKLWCFIPILLMSFIVSAQGTVINDICNTLSSRPILKETFATYPLTDLSDATGNNNTEILPGINISETNGLCIDNGIVKNFLNLEEALANPNLLSAISGFDFTPVEDNFDPNNFGVKLEFNLSYSPPEGTNTNGIVALGNGDPHLNFLGIIYNYVSEQIGILLADGNILYADVSVPLNQWHTIEVKHFLGQGGFVYLNGVLILAVNTTAIDSVEVELDFSQFDISNLTSEGALKFLSSYANLADGFQSCIRNIEIYKCLPGATEIPSVTENCSVTLEAPEAWDICSGSIVATTTDPTEYTKAGNYVVNWSFEAANGLSELILPQNITVIGKADTTIMWTGAANTDWTDAGNWENNNAPGLSLTANINIPTGLTNYPVLVSGQNLYIGSCSNVMIESGASLTVNPNAVITNDGTVTNKGNLIFESDETGSAYIGSGMGDFIGDATIERYIPAKRAFRFLTSPVTTDDFISNNWQLTTHITGSKVGANGFDITNTGNPSMFGYDNDNQTWNALPNTDATNLITGVPYRLMVRGDRTVDLLDNFATPSITTLIAKGELTSENTNPSPVALNETAGGFSFIGNPFQAQIDMDTVLNSNSTNVLSQFYWVWDPTLGIRGAYATVMLDSGTASAGEQNQYLQAGQACFVQTMASNPASLTFTQASKSTVDTETNVFRSSGDKTAVSGKLNLKLYEREAYTSNKTEADGLWIFFDDAGNNDLDGYDAAKFTNLDENFAIANNNNLLSIENRATAIDSDKIQLHISTYRNSQYTLVAKTEGLTGETPFLHDAYTNIYTELPLNGSVEYSYSVDENISASIAEDRFTIVYQVVSLSVTKQEIIGIQMYPNPTSLGKFYLNIPLGMDDLEVEIYSTLGAKLYHTNEFTPGSKTSINTNFALSQGVYFVNLSSQGETVTKKLVVD